MKTKMCTYCGKQVDPSTLTPLYEKGKNYVSYYCERCWPDVAWNLKSLPWKHLYTFGKKGESPLNSNEA